MEPEQEEDGAEGPIEAAGGRAGSADDTAGSHLELCRDHRMVVNKRPVLVLAWLLLLLSALRNPRGVWRMRRVISSK